MLEELKRQSPRYEIKCSVSTRYDFYEFRSLLFNGRIDFTRLGLFGQSDDIKIKSCKSFTLGGNGGDQLGLYSMRVSIMCMRSLGECADDVSFPK